MAYGIGSNTTLRYRVNMPTFVLKASAENRRIVWHTHTNCTPHESCRKWTNSSIAEPTRKGERVTRSLLPSWRMTTGHVCRILTSFRLFYPQLHANVLGQAKRFESQDQNRWNYSGRTALSA